MESGDVPEVPPEGEGEAQPDSGEEPPEKPDGEGQPDGGEEPPEKPDGEDGTMSGEGQPPELPAGETLAGNTGPGGFGGAQAEFTAD